MVFNIRDIDDTQAPLLDHLIELRARLMRCIFALLLAFGVCAREAVDQGKRLDHHLQHLVAHGVLHLLGYDHMTDDEAAEMEGLERVVMAGLGAPDPYASEQGDHG